MQKEKTEEGAAKNAVPPSADGVNSPVRRAWKAGPVSSAHHPKAVPAAGIYPPGQRHKPARFHALYGSVGLSCCWNSASGTPAPSAPANPALPHTRPAPFSADRLPG